jgi:hypothetical protein
LPVEAEEAVEKLLNIVEALSADKNELAEEVQRLRKQLEQKKKDKTTATSQQDDDQAAPLNSNHSSEKQRRKRDKKRLQRGLAGLDLYEKLSPVVPRHAALL